MHSFWKLSGLVLSIIGGFLGSVASMGYAWGGCEANIECAVVPQAAGLLALVSLVLLFICIYALVSDLYHIKTIVISYLVIAIILVLSIFLFRSGGIAYNATHNTSFECSLFSDYKNGICLSNMAKEKNDVMLCNSINDSIWKDECTSYFAKTSNSPDLCGAGDISCLYIVARNTKDQKVCERISELGARSNCYTLVAQETGDTSICKKPDNSASKCNNDSLIYLATKIVITSSASTNSLVSGAIKQKIATINLSAVGGDGALSGLSVTNRSDVKLKNVKLIVNGSVINPIRSNQINNQYIQNAVQYDFDFSKEYLVIRGNKQASVSVIADIPNSSTGKMLKVTMGGVSYPSSLTSKVEGIGSVLVNTLIK